MLRFFRQIRKTLMEQNKVRSYILYAVGEIALVMIGILLALQVNNWNERRQNNQLEKEYYCRFLENINQDEDALKSFVANTEKRLVSANQFVRLLQQPKTRKVDAGTASFETILGSAVQFAPNNTAFLDLTAGSNLNLLKDIKAKEALNNYYKKVNDYMEIATLNNNFVVERNISNYSDIRETGYIHARMLTDRYIQGMDQDVYENMNIDFTEYIKPKIKDSLINNGVRIISTVYRRLELYSFVQDEIGIMQELLATKCEEK